MVYSLRVQFVMVGKSRWQRLEAAAHLVSSVRKQRDMSATD